MAQPDPESVGVAEMMRAALRRAGVEPERVDYINAHGTSTPLGDLAETRAIKDVFGDHAYKLAVSSTKSVTGHCFGAAGAIEAMMCALAIHHGVIPPTMNYETPDPECDLDYVPNEAREARVDVALSNAMGLGGHNGCVLARPRRRLTAAFGCREPSHFRARLTRRLAPSEPARRAGRAASRAALRARRADRVAKPRASDGAWHRSSGLADMSLARSGSAGSARSTASA